MLWRIDDAADAALERVAPRAAVGAVLDHVSDRQPALRPFTGRLAKRVDDRLARLIIPAAVDPLCGR
jgi:hypothetical protein